MSNINTFLTSFDKEFSRSCNFEVIINRIPLGTRFDTETLKLRCDNAEIPSRTFALAQQKIYGPVFYHPVQSAYDKITLTFLCSDDMREKRMFDTWLNYISPSGDTVVAGLGDIFTPGVLFDFEYYDNYVTTIDIKQKDLTNNDAYTARLYEAYPIAINPMPLSWDSVNVVNKLSVSFAYKYFREQTIYTQIMP